MEKTHRLATILENPDMSGDLKKAGKISGILWFLLEILKFKIKFLTIGILCVPLRYVM